VRREKPLFFFLERYAQSYRNEWDHFTRVLQGQEASCSIGEDGRRALLLAETAYRSLETGQRVTIADIEGA
jgi:myo-inositol 2-dehydrogenase/D-chiro-inositol 1-dehydrogenase